MYSISSISFYDFPDSFYLKNIEKISGFYYRYIWENVEITIYRQKKISIFHRCMNDWNRCMNWTNSQSHIRKFKLWTWMDFFFIFFYTKFDKWEVTHYEIYDPLNVCFEHIIAVLTNARVTVYNATWRVIFFPLSIICLLLTWLPLHSWMPNL